MATIRDIAKLSGYSIGTVSRVINNRADVSPEAREKIERIIQEQNYQPNTNAKMLKQTVSSEVSVIVRGINNPFLETILEEIQIRMSEHGESVNVYFINEMDNEVETAVNLSRNIKPKGIVFLGGGVNTFRDSFDKISAPSVLVTQSADMLGFDNLSSFSTDDEEAAGQAVRQLISYGHKRIGIIGGSRKFTDENVSSSRLRGAVKTLRENGIDFSEERDHEDSLFSMEDGRRAVGRLLDRAPDITAIFALSDSLAIGAMRGLNDRGLRIPEDISIIGYDGIDYCRYSVPRLATVRQDTKLLARRCVDELLLMISYKHPAIHEVIPYELIDGESISRPCK